MAPPVAAVVEGAAPVPVAERVMLADPVAERVMLAVPLPAAEVEAAPAATGAAMSACASQVELGARGQLSSVQTDWNAAAVSGTTTMAAPQRLLKAPLSAVPAAAMSASATPKEAAERATCGGSQLCASRVEMARRTWVMK